MFLFYLFMAAIILALTIWTFCDTDSASNPIFVLLEIVVTVALGAEIGLRMFVSLKVCISKNDATNRKRFLLALKKVFFRFWGSYFDLVVFVLSLAMTILTLIGPRDLAKVEELITIYLYVIRTVVFALRLISIIRGSVMSLSLGCITQYHCM